MPSRDDLSLLMIPPHAAIQMAQLYSGMFVRALAAAGETDARACLADLAIGRRQLWAIFKRGRSGPLALFRTEIVVENDGGRWLCVSALYGRGLWQWGRMLADGMVETAKACQCKAVRFAGRGGWGRVLRDFKPTTSVGGETIFEREVCDVI